MKHYAKHKVATIEKVEATLLLSVIMLGLMIAFVAEGTPLEKKAWYVILGCTIPFLMWIFTATSKKVIMTFAIILFYLVELPLRFPFFVLIHGLSKILGFVKKHTRRISACLDYIESEAYTKETLF